MFSNCVVAKCLTPSRHHAQRGRGKRVTLKKGRGIWGSRGRHFVGFILWFFLCCSLLAMWPFQCKRARGRGPQWACLLKVSGCWWSGGEGRKVVGVCLCGLCFGCGFGNLFHIAPHIATLTFARWHLQPRPRPPYPPTPLCYCNLTYSRELSRMFGVVSPFSYPQQEICRSLRPQRPWIFSQTETEVDKEQDKRAREFSTRA